MLSCNLIIKLINIKLEMLSHGTVVLALQQICFGYKIPQKCWCSSKGSGLFGNKVLSNWGREGLGWWDVHVTAVTGRVRVVLRQCGGGLGWWCGGGLGWC